MKNWYLLKTKPRQEKLAINNLNNQNYHTYCPFALINKKVQFLFPGYLFIQLDETTQNWSPIKSTKGVLDFVKFGLNFPRIPDSVIVFIKENEHITLNKLININSFKKGDEVQITQGVFKNFIAIYKSVKSDERILLLLKIMGQEQTLSINKKSLIGL